MEPLKNCIAVYEVLRKKRYCITITDENADPMLKGAEISFVCNPENFHHLVGLQHLTDLPHIASPAAGRDKIYRDLKKGAIREADVFRSTKISEIQERIDSFPLLLKILEEGEGKIIVSFDKSRIGSKIEAQFFLFYRDGTPAQGNLTYHTFFIGYDDKKGKYYPATYLVEHSPLYMRDQTMLECKIQHKKK